MAPKRAQATKAERAPKKAKLSPEQEMLQRVVLAIHGAEQLPPSCRELLATAADGSLNVVKDNRHASQDKVIGMIGEALTELRDAKDAAVSSEAEKLKAAEAQLAALQAAGESAEAALAQRTEAVKAAEEKVAHAQGALLEASTTLKSAEAAVEQAKQTQSAKEAESAAFDAAAKDNFAMLLDGTWGGEAQAQQQIECLGPFIAQLHLDESLRTALPAACVKSPSSRGSFDCLVLEQAQKAFADKAAQLRAAAAACAPAVNEATVASEAARKALEDAQATAAALTTALGDAKGEESQGAAASAAATQEVKNFEAELKQVTRGHSIALSELELVQGPLADFEALRDRTAKVAETAAETVAEIMPALAGA